MPIVLRTVIYEVLGFRSCVDEVRLWDVTPRCWAASSRHFETTYRSYLQGSKRPGRMNCPGRSYLTFRALKDDTTVNSRNVGNRLLSDAASHTKRIKT